MTTATEARCTGPDCGTVLSRYNAFTAGDDEIQLCGPCRRAAFTPEPVDEVSTGDGPEDHAETALQREQRVATALRARPCGCPNPILDAESNCVLCGRAK